MSSPYTPVQAIQGPAPNRVMHLAVPAEPGACVTQVPACGASVRKTVVKDAIWGAIGCKRCWSVMVPKAKR